MQNKNVIEEAKEFGELLRKTRESNNLTLSKISEDLEIRSYLLNDMEKGRFAHIKQGDCQAYAKYLGLNINQAKLIREQVLACGNSENSYGNVGRSSVYIGVGILVTIAIILVVGMSTCSRSSKPTELVVPKTLSDSSEELVITPTEESNKKVTTVEEIKPIVQDNVQNVVQDPVQEEVFVAPEIVDEPDVAVIDNQQVLVVEEASIVNNEKVKEQELNNTESQLVTQQAKEKPKVSDNKDTSKENSNVTTVRESKEKPQNVNSNNKPNNSSLSDVKVNKPTTSDKKNNVADKKNTSDKKNNSTSSQSKPIKAGEVRPFIDDTPKKNNVKNDSPKKVEQPKNNTVAPKSEPKPIKAGEVRPLVESPNNKANKTTFSSSDSKIMDQEEIKRMADQVVITEAVIE